jgi:hypothetical protein
MGCEGELVDGWMVLRVVVSGGVRVRMGVVVIRCR